MQKTDSFFLLPGTVLHMKYRINSVIGQGGFGITYDGTDLKLDMHVAIKEYFPHSMADRENTVSLDVTCTSGTRDLYEKGMKNFLTEAKNMARYAGEENFVAVHDYFAENNTAYIVMEFIEGQNLKQYLKNYGRLTMNQAMPIIMPVMNTLEKIHERHMIHRDISPSNIMILPDGRVRLLDFGAAKEISMETVDMSAMSAVFKRGYSPIEQLTYGMKQGPYTDIYALCATIYEMLTLCTPPSPLQRAHEGEVLIPPSQLGAKISPVQEAALLKGLEINGADRIQSIWELRAAFCEGDFGYDRYEGGGAPRGNVLTISLIAAASILLLILAVMVVSSRNLYKPGCDTSSRDFCRSFCVASSQSLYLPLSGYKWPSDPGKGDGGDDQDDHPAPDEIPDAHYHYSGHTYGFYDAQNYGLGSYSAVQNFCARQGGHLAVINSPAENSFLFDLVKKNYTNTVFFGYSDEIAEGVWEWDGDSSSYTNWTQYGDWDLPDNGADFDGDEDYAEFNYDGGKSWIPNDGTWNDAVFMENTSVFLCEWEYIWR